MNLENGDVVKKEDGTEHDLGYAILNDDFIKIAFEASDACSGSSGLSQEVADALNQDVCYRIREVTHMATQMMRHGGRRRLSHADMRRALHWYRAPPVLGHSTCRPQELLAVPEAGVWVPEERECDLAQLAASADPPPPASLLPRLTAHWLAVDGRRSDVKLDPEELTEAPPLSPAETGYYDQITRALFGANLELLKIALHDMETSPHLAPVLPHLLRCILLAIRRLTSRPYWMHRLLLSLQALTRNVAVNLGSKPNLNHIASALVFCAIEGQPKTANSPLDPVCVKEFAARLLAQLVYKWTTPVNELPEQIARTLHDTVRDRRKCLRSQFGAITALVYMGPEAVLRYLCPLLSEYVPAMQEVLSTVRLDLPTRMDAMRVQAAIGVAIQQYLQYKAREFAACPESAGPGPPPLPVYRMWADLCDQLAPAPPPPECVAALAAGRPRQRPPPPARGAGALWPAAHSRRPADRWPRLVRVPQRRRSAPAPVPVHAAFEGAPLRQRFPTIYFSFIGASPLPEHLLRRVQFPQSHPFATEAPLDARARRGRRRCWPPGGGHVHRCGDPAAWL